MSGAPSDLPPSYEEAQRNAPYPPSYPGQTDDFPKQNAGYGYPPPAVGGQQPYQTQPGFNQQYPYGAPQTGPYPPQGPYPAQGPYPTQGGPQTYTYPPAVAAYNQQGVVVQPGTTILQQPQLSNTKKMVIVVVTMVIIVFIILVLIAGSSMAS